MLLNDTDRADGGLNVEKMLRCDEVDELHNDKFFEVVHKRREQPLCEMNLESRNTLLFYHSR